MAFEFKPDTQAQVPVVRPPSEHIGRFNLIIIALFVVAVGVWAAWNPLSSSVKASWARRCAQQARLALSENDLTTAFEQIMKARRWAPEDVEVIRGMIEVLKSTQVDPGALVQQLRLLSEKQPLTAEEETLLGRNLIAMGKTVEARSVYEKIPLQETSNPQTLDLLSNLLSAEGHPAEAAEITRRSLQKQSDSPEARLQLAVADLANPSFAEIQRRARLELWQIAQATDETALAAITRLAQDSELSQTEVQQLLALVEKHPHQSLQDRLQVVSALIRLNPDQKKNILDAETKRFQAANDGKLPVFAGWLAQEKQHARILKLMPRDLAAKSRELYPIIADALAVEGRWKELEEMLDSGRPPVSRELADVWRAEVKAHLMPDLKETRSLLEGSIDAATRQKNPAALLAAASLAEKLDLIDLALAAYQSAASQGGETSVPFLRKAEELALRQKNAALLLEISRKLHELRPSSAAFGDQLIYLRLILGIELETIDFAALEHTDEMREAFTVTLERIPASLLRALLAYRLGDQQNLEQQLKRLPDTARLPPGQRAVVAGLLSKAGSTARAFQIAEKIPEIVLLDEERAFLNRAK